MACVAMLHIKKHKAGTKPGHVEAMLQ